ncbi:MAG: phosphoribosylanthranilate isomerase [Gemmataceae bacterium]
MRIKICGLTNVADARVAAELGADAIGLNFYPKSKRSIDESTAAMILKEMPAFVDPVALFVNESIPEVVARVRRLEGIRTVQLHGDDLEVVPNLAYSFIPAFSVRDEASLSMVDAYLVRCRENGRLPTAVLLDAHVPGEYGGTGQTAPWDVLAKYSCEVPIILAGGLTPENVADAVRIVKPYGVDVASGVELTPGKKDHEKMREFINAARGRNSSV